MNIGIIGFGNMGKTHAYAIENIKYFYDTREFTPKVYGISASTFENAEKYREKFGFEKAFKDWKELIDSPDIDVIDICVPNIYHYEILKYAIESGKPIYCEKPLCTTSEQSDEIAKLAESKGISNAVVFNTRFLAPVVKAKKMIDEGAIGDIVSYNISFLHSSAMNPERTGWKQDKNICGGGVLFDLGSHALDMLTHLCGKVDCVYGQSQILFKNRKGIDGSDNWETNADEAFYMLTSLKNGAKGTVTVSKIHAGANDDFNFEIYGTKGALRFALMEPNKLWYHSESDSERGFKCITCVNTFDAPAAQFPGGKATVGWLRGHVGSMFNFLNAANKGIVPSPSFKDGAYIQHLLECAYKSDEENMPVKIDF